MYIKKDTKLFNKLHNQWLKERGVTSSITEMSICPSYQRIIGMGRRAIPLIIKQLENENENPDHWFWALNAITGENPITEPIRGKMKEMAKVWIDLAYKKRWIKHINKVRYSNWTRYFIFLESKCKDLNEFNIKELPSHYTYAYDSVYVKFTDEDGGIRLMIFDSFYDARRVLSTHGYFKGDVIFVGKNNIDTPY